MSGTVNNNAGYINDLGSLDRIRKMGFSGEEGKAGALKQAAAQFEALFTQTWMKSVRETEKELFKDNPFSSHTTELYQSMLDEQMASNLAGSGKSLQSGSLADLIVKQFDKSSKISKNSKNEDGSFRMPDESRNFNISGDVKSFSINGDLKSFSLANAAKTQRTGQVNGTSDYFGTSLDIGERSVRRNEVNSRNIALFEDLKSQKEYSKSLPASATSTDFVEKIMPIAQKIASKYGLNPLAMVAQAALETGWGKHLMKKGTEVANNYFGIKASRNSANTTRANSYEYVNGRKVMMNSKFRAYDSVEQSLEDYAKLITGNNRYDKVKNSDTVEKYFEELQKAGYATDPNYANKLKKIVKNSAFDRYRDVKV